VTTTADPSALVVVDTSVLLAATDRSRSAHDSATAFLNEDERRLALTPQIIREYLAVATRPIEANGFGVPGRDAVANLDQLLADMVLLSESSTTVAVLRDLVVGHTAAGRQVHDANVVAVALAHGATAIVTDDARHFARFAGLITVEGLTAAP
jgi:predicted nucleic acid-binding protein